jgi:FKBP-type peptidyl-prolyl cis-trans isomerase FkpA
MKKILLTLGVGIALMAFNACSNQEKKAAAEASVSDYPAVTVTAAEDSMSQTFGKGFGAFIAGQIQSSPEAEKLFDQEAFIKGLELVMKCDTSMADNNFLGGVQQGILLLEQLSELERANDITFDRKKVVENVILALGNKKKLTEDEITNMQQSFNRQLEEAKTANQTQMLKAGEKFVADKLAADKSLKKTKSGLIYKITKPGTGANFKVNDNVMVKYKGTHVDGTVFDQNDKGTPMKLNEQTLIPGFVELLQLMNPGAKAYAIIPADIAYGKEGSLDQFRNKRIKGNETIVFEVETVGIAKEEKEAKK